MSITNLIMESFQHDYDELGQRKDDDARLAGEDDG